MLAALIGNIVCIASVLGGAASTSFVRPTEILEPSLLGNGMTPSWLPQNVLPVTGGASHTSSGHLLHQIMAPVIATIMSMVIAAAVMVHPVVSRVYSTRIWSTHGGLGIGLTTPMTRSVAIYRQLQDILGSHALPKKLKTKFRQQLMLVLNHYPC